MTQDEVIEMARQAGFWKDLFAYPEFKEHVETFAKLVEDFATAKEREGLVRIIEANIADEREACLRIQEDWQCVYASDLVQKIRARGEK
jgi:hypothetical protein